METLKLDEKMLGNLQVACEMAKITLVDQAYELLGIFTMTVTVV